MSLLPHLTQRLHQHLRRLRTTDRPLRLNQEERHTINAQLARQLLISTHIRRVTVALQHRLNLGSIQANLRSNIQNRLVILHRTALRKVRQLKRLLRRRRQTLLRRIMNHTVRIKRVTVACLTPIEIQTHLAGTLRQRLLARNRLLQRHLILTGNHLRQRTGRMLRSRRVQLKTMPHHLNLVTVLKLGERLLQVTLAHVAEGAHNIGPNINTHVIYSSHTRMRHTAACMLT